MLNRNFTPKRIKIILWIATAGIIAGLSIVFFTYRNTPTEIRPDTESPVNPEAAMSLDKVTQTSTKNGVKQWKLSALSVDLFEKKGSAVFKTVDMIIFQKDGTEIHLSADRGVWNTATNDIDFSGNVIVSPPGYRINTEKLHYNNKMRIITTTSSVRISSDSVNLTAKVLSADLENNSVKLSGNVQGDFSEDFSL